MFKPSIGSDMEKPNSFPTKGKYNLQKINIHTFNIQVLLIQADSQTIRFFSSPLHTFLLYHFLLLCNTKAKTKISLVYNTQGFKKKSKKFYYYRFLSYNAIMQKHMQHTPILMIQNLYSGSLKVISSWQIGSFLVE